MIRTRETVRLKEPEAEHKCPQTRQSFTNPVSRIRPTGANPKTDPDEKAEVNLAELFLRRWSVRQVKH